MLSALLIPKKQCHTSRWSGGTTTQLAIYPPQAQYPQRNFIWRLSSATVEDETSTFTPLPDYQRILSIIQGELTLSHNGESPIRLAPLELNHFDGAFHTFSQGRVTDFNLMLRKGCCTGSVLPLSLSSGSSTALHFLCSPGEFPLFTLALYCAWGAPEVTASLPQPRSFSLSPGDLLLFSSNQEEKVPLSLACQEDSAVFFCDIKHKE